jgi:oligopeptide transport system substrate-binding protein
MPAPLLRRAFAAAVLLAGCAVAGCSNSGDGDVRVTVIGGNASIVDPSGAPLTAPQEVLMSNAAQGLVRFDARGQIEPGLAERWNVTDDGLSYIFRLQSGEWPAGGKVTANQIARLLKRQLAERSKNEIKDTFGVVSEIVPMTDRVLEIRLKAPRPNLLQLLAQPEMAIARDGQGTGPFDIAADSKLPVLTLIRTVTSSDGEDARKEDVDLGTASAPDAIRAFLADKTDLVLGGTYADLPLIPRDKLARNALRFDPAGGLFGLVPLRKDGPAGNLELRRLLSQAIDRQALIDALNVTGLLPRATVLEPGLDGVGPPVVPDWVATPIAQRRAPLAGAVASQLGGVESPTIRIALPESRGAALILRRIATDWGALGLKVEAAKRGQPADFALIDSVAPSTSPAWYVRQFRCGVVPICDSEADTAMDVARTSLIPAERGGQIALAAAIIDRQQLFLPIAAPIRWSLVSDRVPGFATNRYARHTLTDLTVRLNRERAE